MNTTDIISNLLHEEESSSLDFKREQYKFNNATDIEKSELLKDILAFSNSWRRSDAYILIGIEEQQGGRSSVIGINNHIDDAKIQQFVNSKTNRPIEFSYIACTFNNKQVAIIQIPVQKRPFYLVKDFGKLEKHVVYIRRGSSTDKATPDEVASMGQELSKSELDTPILSCYLVTGEHDEIISDNIKLTTVNTVIPDESQFPKYGDTSQKHLALQLTNIFTNMDYYSEYARYHQNISRVKAIKIGVKNDGNSVAKDIKVVLTINEPHESLIVLRDDKLPNAPTKESSSFSNSSIFLHQPHKHDISIKSLPSGWAITCILGKAQAGDMVVSYDLLCLGSYESKTINIEAKIFSDNLRSPVLKMLAVEFLVAQKTMTVNDFVKGDCGI